MTNDPKVADKVKLMKAELGTEEQSEDEKILSGISLSGALKDNKFWLLVACFLPISFAVGGPIPNFEKILDSKGFNLTDGVLLASVVGYSVVIGRLIGGYLLDKLWAPGVAFVFFVIPVIACLLFRQADMSYVTAALAIGVLGLSAGVEYDLMAYLVSKYFGFKNYSAIYGALYGFFAIGAGFGPYFFAKSFVANGSYDVIFGYAAIAFVVGALPLLFLGKYRYD